MVGHIVTAGTRPTLWPVPCTAEPFLKEFPRGHPLCRSPNALVGSGCPQVVSQQTPLSLTLALCALDEAEKEVPPTRGVDRDAEGTQPWWADGTQTRPPAPSWAVLSFATIG